ncbi:DctM-like transporters [mine drainage metagenome]|uniref:DctM-like transporters n=1 Tax=mine drainage metagenome TaxID=410659 RepID=A0A1J5Q6L9_9ZZZZ
MAAPGADALRAEQRLDDESGTRRPHARGLRTLLFALATSWSAFQLWAIADGGLNPQILASIHLAFAFALCFLAHPGRHGKRAAIPWSDWALALLGVLAAGYIAWDYETLSALQGGMPNARDVALGSVLLAVLALAALRVIGWALPAIAALMIGYAAIGPAGLVHLTPPEVLYLHNGYPWSQIVQQLYVSAEGVWGTPIQVSATFVFLFVVFGALLDRAGAGQYFVTLAYSALGNFRGGPAKAAVVGSMLDGVISGSSTANVVTVGTFTIPLMKRVGIPAVKAGAIECAASVNGQLMPPVMGAAAFIMANFIGVPYAQIVVHALLPALLTYLGLMITVHIEATRLGLRPTPRAELPPFWSTLVGGLHHLAVVGFLLHQLMVRRLTPERSALNATLLVGVVLLVQRVVHQLRAHGVGSSAVVSGLRDGALDIAHGLAQGARNMTMIAVATAAAGIVVGMVTMTNLGYGLTELIGTLSGHNIWLVLLLSAGAALLLGMGLPTTANYIVMASLVAPVIVRLAAEQQLGVPLVAVHLFVFFFGILADDTPPVGLAAIAASAIARADPVKIGVQAFAYDLRTAILPFFFFFNPKLLLIGIAGPLDLACTVGGAALGMYAFVAALQGHMRAPLTVFERALLLGASLWLIRPDTAGQWLGALAVVALYVLNRRRARAT